MTGELRGIAFKRVRRGAVETAVQTHISMEAGVAQDRLGALSKRRQVTVLRAEDWADACADVGVELPWTARRANLLVAGLPSFKGKIGWQIHIGDVVLEITGETDPCSRMGEVHIALPDALTSHWRGGATCRVLSGGEIAVGDKVTLQT